ncbi:MAG: EthD domain-containing protein [Deltaproteobacteria bacterium]|nr:EthD domain-containing protein [Deltaproteobacteria bacterium]
MIHQFIFAGPKPGLTAEAFQSYWVNVHAVDFAAKIPQLRQYLVALRVHVPYPREVPFFEGVAEIWFAGEAEQIASLQSPEFLNGARADEPRWAAFWQSLVLDTDPRLIRGDRDSADEFVKIYVLLKRSPAMALGEFQAQLTADDHCAAVAGLPQLRRHLIGLARPGLYGLGEPRFDAVEVWSFRDVSAAQAALADEAGSAVVRSWSKFTDPRYLFTMVAREHWIIPPGQR